MATRPTQPDSKAGTDGNGTMPRWVKVFGIIALIVLLLFIIMLLTRGSHGPGRHLRGGGSQTMSVALVEHPGPQS